MAICSEIYRIVYVIVGRNVQRLESEDIFTNNLSTSAQQLSMIYILLFYYVKQKNINQC
jgi:hypothetical protein